MRSKATRRIPASLGDATVLSGKTATAFAAFLPFPAAMDWLGLAASLEKHLLPSFTRGRAELPWDYNPPSPGFDVATLTHAAPACASNRSAVAR